MSNTTSVDSFLSTIRLIQTNTVIYGYLFIFILGNIGSIFNILVLTRRNYLQKSCSCYILASSVTNLVITNVVVFFRLLTGFNIDPTQTSWLFCKFRAYAVQMTTLLSRIYIVLACIDRWAMTSAVVRQRAFTDPKVPKILIPGATIVCGLSFLHVAFYQNIVQGRCVISSDVYSKFYNIYNTVISGILIPVFMIIFSLLTIRNVKRLQQRIAQNTIAIERLARDHMTNKRNHDYQLFFMIFVQQCVYIITTSPFVSYLLYSTITMSSTKSPSHTATDTLYMTIVYTLLHVNFSATFYIYTLTAPMFRKDLKRILVHNQLVRVLLNRQQTTTLPAVEMR